MILFFIYNKHFGVNGQYSAWQGEQPKAISAWITMRVVSSFQDLTAFSMPSGHPAKSSASHERGVKWRGKTRSSRKRSTAMRHS
ncbi:hypothetical protein DTW90_28325 [Neorhizobium sp. P12A]|nr:hypothetical protein DTW90_28325 [Neorhizobium sp. P12A]